ncbi:MAG: hypothetical protein JKY95_14955 [Planctomycetaceae bacterium]|nr:hypothetical protein [Planctomycetaceae bacterium]
MAVHYSIDVYNNIMDDLDGILAAKLQIRSEFGAILDNVCDAFAHTLFVLLVAMQYADLGNSVNMVSIAIALSGFMAATALLFRVVTRLSPNLLTGTGTATNELMRHLLFVLLLSNYYEFNPGTILIVTFILHAVSMLVPFRMPYLVRTLSKTATTVTLVNVAIVVAWLLPLTLPVIAGCFAGTYLYSFIVGGLSWLQQENPDALTNKAD